MSPKWLAQAYEVQTIDSEDISATSPDTEQNHIFSPWFHHSRHHKSYQITVICENIIKKAPFVFEEYFDLVQSWKIASTSRINHTKSCQSGRYETGKQILTDFFSTSSEFCYNLSTGDFFSYLLAFMLEWEFKSLLFTRPRISRWDFLFRRIIQRFV
jgi:hypothetical protein